MHDNSLNTGIRLTLIDLTVADGFSEVGAGIVNMGGTLELSGVTISNNVARREANYGGGGAIDNSGWLSTLNCSIWDNAAWAGSGLNGCASACRGTNGIAIGFSLRSR